MRYTYCDVTHIHRKRADVLQDVWGISYLYLIGEGLNLARDIFVAYALIYCLRVLLT